MSLEVIDVNAAFPRTVHVDPVRVGAQGAVTRFASCPYRVLALAALCATMLLLGSTVNSDAYTTLREGRFFESAHGAPTLTAAGEVLSWDATDPTNSYNLRRKAPGKPVEYALVKTLAVLPPSIPGATVGYSVKAVLGGTWSAESMVSYPATGTIGGTLEGLSATEISEGRFFVKPSVTPELAITEGILSWEPVEPPGYYVIRRNPAEGPTEYALLRNTSALPPALAGQTVGYSVKAALGSTWSPEVAITYPATEPEEEPPPGESECDLYASNSGSDSNPGTGSAPFATPHKLAVALAAGQTGCLASGQTFDVKSPLYIRTGEAHGAAGAPVTITSTDPGNPAIITGWVAIASDYITLEHIKFDWSMPMPWECWNAEGHGYECPGEPQNPEDHVQVVLNGKHDSLTWDDIGNHHTDICVIAGTWGSVAEEHALIEHTRIHDCGPPVRSSSEVGTKPWATYHTIVNEEWGWHAHAFYDQGRHDIIRNSYLYGASRSGCLFYPSGEGDICEHNVIDSNGIGANYGSSTGSIVRWNIITNSTSPRKYFNVGVGSYRTGSGSVLANNCIGSNLTGEIQTEGVALLENLTGQNPLYTNAAEHNYKLQAGSPCVGYGPDTAQP